MDDLSEYKDLYLQTSREYLQSLDNSLLMLEKNPTDKESIEEIFHNAHSFKSQNAAMGYTGIGYLCHVIEDIFFEIRKGRMNITPELADLIFSAIDSLKRAIDQIEKENKEPDVSRQIEELKKITGVTTEGAGKSIRTEESAAQESTTITAPSPKVKSAIEDTSPPPIDTKKIKQNSGDEAKKSNTEKSIIKTINVKVEQLDEMMNLLEELYVYHLHLDKIARSIDSEDLKDYKNQTEKIIGSLRFQIMRARAVPLKVVFDHFPRAVRDLAREENKEINFIIEGEDLELDRSIVDRIDEPLIHLIRNAVSHGIEKKGEIRLSAKREDDYAIIKVIDNGAGINWQAITKKTNTETDDPAVLKKLLFSGISTSEQVTQISGRGVGLKVVLKMVEDLGGKVDVVSRTHEGTSFILQLPLTLAVTKAVIVNICQERYAIPASAIERLINISKSDIKRVADQEAIILNDNEVPLIRMSDKLNNKKDEKTNAKDQSRLLAIIIQIKDNERIGLIVDEIIETANIVVKPVPNVFKKNKVYTGVTILGDGQSTLVLNPKELL